MTYERMRST